MKKKLNWIMAAAFSFMSVAAFAQAPASTKGSDCCAKPLRECCAEAKDECCTKDKGGQKGDKRNGK